MFLEEAADHLASSRKPSCVELAMQRNPDQAKNIFESVWGMVDSDVSSVALAFIFSQHGIKLSSKQIRRHVRSECACDPTVSGSNA